MKKFDNLENFLKNNLDIHHSCSILARSVLRFLFIGENQKKHLVYKMKNYNKSKINPLVQLKTPFKMLL